MKTRAGYWISGGLIVVAAVGAILWIATSIGEMTDRVDAFARVSADSEETVRLEARKYVIYTEHRNGDVYSGALHVTITGANGEPVPTAPYLSELTYSYGGHDGTAQQTVTPDRAGEYRIRVQSTAVGTEGAAVALGESLSPLLLRTIFGAILIGAIFGLSGIALLATTIVRRHNARTPTYTGPPPVFVPAAPPEHVQPPAYGRETPYGQEDPPPPYGQRPSPGEPPPPDDPPPLWSGGG